MQPAYNFTAIALLAYGMSPAWAECKDREKCCVARIESTKHETQRDCVSSATFVSMDKCKNVYMLGAYHSFCGFNSIEVQLAKGGDKYSLKDIMVADSFIMAPDLDLVAMMISPAGKSELAKCGIFPARLAASTPPTTAVLLAYGNPAFATLDVTRSHFAYCTKVTISSELSFGEFTNDKFSKGNARNTVLQFLESLGITHGFSGGALTAEWREKDGTDIFEIAGIIIGGDDQSGKHSWSIPSRSILHMIGDSNRERVLFPPKFWKQPQFTATFSTENNAETSAFNGAHFSNVSRIVSQDNIGSKQLQKMKEAIVVLGFGVSATQCIYSECDSEEILPRPQLRTGTRVVIMDTSERRILIAWIDQGVKYDGWIELAILKPLKK